MNEQQLNAYLDRLQQRDTHLKIPRHRRGDGPPVPASYAQRHLWLHAQLAPGEPLYSEPVTIHRTGPLDVAALEASLGEIVRRHEAWRTTFVMRDGALRQIVHPPFRVALPVDDLRRLPPEEREREALRLATGDAVEPFDVERGPLLRGRLIRLADDEHRLYLALHHIIFDGVSIYRVLLPELTTLYEALASGRPATLPEPAIQYRDFAAWQHEWVTGAEAERQLGYWRTRLQGAPPTLALPLDHPRPPTQAFAGAMHRIEIPRPLADALKAVGLRAGVTFYMTMLTAFAALLYRYTAEDDLVIGTVTAGRKRPEVEHLLGYFLNPLALRLDVSGDPTFEQTLGRVRDVVLDALGHDDVPFESVVAAVRRERDASRNPVFQVMFSLEPPLPALPQGWRLTQLDVEVGTAKLDLYLELDDRPEGVIGRFVYKTDLFAPSTIARMAGHFRELLDGIVANPGQRLSALPLLTEAERRRVLVEWNDTARPLPATTIHDAFEAQARRSPRAPALVSDAGRMTYEALDRRAGRLAQRLRALGVGPNVRVAVCVERSPEMIVGMLGVLEAGGAYVPLDPTYPRERLAFMLEDSGAVALLTQHHLRSALPERRPPTITLDADDEPREALAPAITATPVGGDDLAYVIYTSGSTGRPKGVAVPHRGIIRLLFGVDYVHLGADETILQITSVSFDVSEFEIWGALLHGGCLVIPPPGVPTPQLLREQIRRHDVTTLWVTASLFNSVVDVDARSLRGLRQLVIGGEALSVAHVRRAMAELPGTVVINGYGPTEASVFACAYRLPGPPAADATSVPIGPPIANTRAYVLDRAMNPVPIGVAGELYLGGPGVARGYLNRPELTAEKFVADPFGAPGERLYRTGDLARWLPDGTLDYLGRTDAQVKVRGFRVEPGEIEAVLAEHPAVAQAAVVARSSAAGASLVAWVVPRDGSEIDVAKLRSFLGDTLPPYMIPGHIVSVTALPLTGSGKVDRQALLGQALPVSRGPGIAARTTLERELVTVWEEMLGVRPIGVTDDFFDLGGHSLLAVRLAKRLEDAFGHVLPLRVLLANPTIERLAAALLRPEKDDDPAALIPLHADGQRRPLFLFHGDLAGAGAYGFRLARLLGRDQPLYLVPPLGLDGPASPPTIEQMAAVHLGAIRAVQPSGPYRLLGYCNGGLVAYDAARQLAASGEQVELLAIIAALPDLRLRHVHRLLRPALGAVTARDLIGRTRAFLDRWSASSSRGRLSMVRETARRLLGRAGAEGFETQYSRYFLAVMGYIPRRYPDQLLVLWPSDEPLRITDDPTLGWGPLTGGVEVEFIPGDHTTVVTGHVDRIAERLGKLL